MDHHKLTQKLTSLPLNHEDDFLVVSPSSETTRVSFSKVDEYILDSKKYELSQSTGLSGDKGEKGMYGIRGEFGFPGNFGDVGLKGFKGAKGDKGLRGYKGYTGQSGYNGRQGEIGDTAEDGQKGQKGQKGNVGATGQNAEKGENGFKGTRGFFGTNKIGRPGNVGSPGKKYKGSTGYKGFKGKPSSRRGDKGQRGRVGEEYQYSDVRRSFKKSNNSSYHHARMLSFLFSVNNSSSISITTNTVLMEQIRNRRFLVFELTNDPSKLVSQKYSNFFLEIDFEPFISSGGSPVMTKSAPIYCKHQNEIGTISFDWYKDNSNNYHISFFGIFTPSNQTTQLQIKTIYSFSSLHMNKIIAGEFKNLRI
tara:strand:+ start:4089 stop:5180 length:1092 start_codon:yes stop_codon:yes gene_type:complete